MAAVDWAMTELRVDGVRSPILVGGSSTTETAVVCVHGNPGTASDWEPLIEPVSAFTRIVAPSMPGYGDADKPNDFDYSAQGYARHLGGILDGLGVRRVHLVMHDLGGPWGLAWAALHPSDLASLTMVSIGVLPGYRWHRFARLYRIPVLGELVLAGASRSAVSWALRLGSRRAMPAAFVDSVLDQYHDAGTRRAVLRFYRATPDLGAVTVRAATALRGADPPTLVIWGAGDPYVPVRFAHMQPEFFRRSEVVILPDSGHWPLVDDPGSVVALVVRFLREQIARDDP